MSVLDGNGKHSMTVFRQAGNVHDTVHISMCKSRQIKARAVPIPHQLDN